MGCDIHFYPEHRKDEDWKHIYVPERFENFNWFVNKYGYNGRNYDLFGILAGVRNDECKPISPPRGVPEDLSHEVAAECDRWEGDAHSHSWYSLKELLEFNWDQPLSTTERWVDAQTYEEWDKEGYAPMSCKYASNSTPIQEEEYLAMRARGEIPPDNTYVVVRERVTYREAAGKFMETIENLTEIGDPDNIRVVFWFDN